MRIEHLTEIIRTADEKAITKQLREIGYIDCKKDKKLRYLSIETLFKGKLEETEFPRQQEQTDLSGRNIHAG